MAERTDGTAMCSDAGEKIDIFVHIEFQYFPGKPPKKMQAATYVNWNIF
jgi:hypothetical protein